MFEDVILAFYLLITIVPRYFCKCNCIFYGGNISCWAYTFCVNNRCRVR